MTFTMNVFSSALQPSAEELSADWLRNNFYSHTGEAFSEQQCPWITAPQGPCWAYDSIQFRIIWLQFAARMFKTNFGLSQLQRSMDQRPEETMFATPDETNCKQVFGRLWKMIEHCPKLRDQCPPVVRQNKTAIKLDRSTCHGAWPRGRSRLADKSIRVGHGNEIDKWVSDSTTTEGDPIARFMKRGAEYPDRKFVLESTPSVKGRSAVEAGRLGSTDHRYHVPCPHCDKFQQIVFGTKNEPGGIVWDKLPNGQSDLDLARRSAHYVCKWCEGRITDIYRPEMMSRGVWVPEGCEVDHDRAHLARELPANDMTWLIGTPKNWGSDYGAQLSVFYALFHGWGDIVTDYLKKKESKRTLQQWINEDKGETWEIGRSKSTPEQIAERLRVDIPTGVVPDGATFVTLTVDQQAADGGFIKWVALAHGASDQTWVIDRGVAKCLADIYEPVIRRQWETTDPKKKMTALISCIDSGWDTIATYAFCNSHPGVLACKGSNTDIKVPYRLAETTAGVCVGQMLFTVNTDQWETEIDAAMNERLPGEVGSLAICSELADDTPFVEELLNGMLDDVVDTRGNSKLLWIKKNPTKPNDYRDAVRYGKAIARLWIEEKGLPKRQGVVTAEAPVERQPEPDPEPEEAFVRSVDDDSDGGWIRQ